VRAHGAGLSVRGSEGAMIAASGASAVSVLERGYGDGCQQQEERSQWQGGSELGRESPRLFAQDAWGEVTSKRGAKRRADLEPDLEPDAHCATKTSFTSRDPLQPRGTLVFGIGHDREAPCS
jgi:hypothetical protein